MKIQTIALLFSVKKKLPKSFLVRLIGILRQCGCRAVADQRLASIFPPECTDVVTFAPYENTFIGAELVLVLGGDGSILHAASRAPRYDIPILGVNFGTVGYMAGIDPEEIDELPSILEGNYRLEKRMMLDVTVRHKAGGGEEHLNALNEAVISNGPIARLMDFVVYANGAPLGDYRSDGIIVSTPTGSTAYALSAGGPVIEPTLSLISITPICSFSPIARPVILGADNRLEIRDVRPGKNEAYLTADGRYSVRLSDGDTVSICASERPLRLIRTEKYSFVRAVREKLSQQ